MAITVHTTPPAPEVDLGSKGTESATSGSNTTQAALEGATPTHVHISGGSFTNVQGDQNISTIYNNTQHTTIQQVKGMYRAWHQLGMLQELTLPKITQRSKTG